MYNLLVAGAGWSGQRDRLSSSRLFEYTDRAIAERYRSGDTIEFARLLALPTLFMSENDARPDEQIARVGSLTRVRQLGRDLSLEYVYDPAISGLTNAKVAALAGELHVDDWELSRTHWAIKDVDLCRVLLREVQPRPRRPRVFTINEPERTEATLVAVMMPFEASFAAVYATIQEAASDAGLRCRRADEIWENPAIIQDIVSLIDRAQVVVCDCTGRNPNVFYEIGIAHALGREVVLITQAVNDVPFDLRHLRFLQYLNNGEGLSALRERLASRLGDLAAASPAGF
jgi:hypothetical protein